MVYHWMVKRGIVVIIFVVFPFIASALTSDEITAQIQQLLTQVQALQQQIIQNAPNAAVNVAQCFFGIRNLSRGASGTDVEDLQRFLMGTGDYTYGEITGFFGSQTEAAVQRFQCKNNILCSGSASANGYGFVGVRTRAAMRNSCSLPLSTASTDTEVTWQYPLPPIQCPAVTQPVCTKGTLISLGNDANGCYRGWKCEVQQSRNSTISLDVSGPSSLWIGETGSWIVRAGSPGSDNVMVHMYFGNETVDELLQELAYPASSRSITRTRAFSSAGDYKVRVEASDTSGSSVNVSSVVQVRGRMCTVGNVTLDHGSSKTFYATANAPTGSSCAATSQERACNNGVLSGNSSYQSLSCIEPPPLVPVEKSCTWNGRSYPPGTVFPFGPLLNLMSTLGSQSAIPSSMMAVCMAPCGGYGGYIAQYKCVNGDWIRTQTQNPWPYPYPMALKPVIYLYPTTTQEVSVQLTYKGELASTYPPYDPSISGWKVIARPDGTLTNLADNREYSYLFWEGKNYDFKIDEAKGFVVKGEETREFLQTKLAELGLIPREYNEFIVFWLPKMENNPYNFIQFVGDEYTEGAPLTTSPQPDSVLRVFMAFKSLNQYKAVTPQIIQPFERKGFSVIEWGGTELTK